MRGRKRSRNTREYMLLRNGSIFIFVIIFILIGTGYSLLTTPLEITGKATIDIVDPDEPAQPGLSVATLKTVSNWGEGCIMTISVTNNDDNYDDWCFSFEVPEETTNVNVHTNAYLSGHTVTIEGKKVIIQMKKINENGSINWVAPWTKGAKKEIQVEFVFNTVMNDIILKNVILNNKIITSELTETIDTTLENEVTTTSLSDNAVNTNVIIKENDNVIDNVQNNVAISGNTIEENNIKNVAEGNYSSLVNQNSIE